MSLILIILIYICGMLGILFEKRVKYSPFFFFVVILILFAVLIGTRNTAIVPDSDVYESHYNYFKQIHTIKLSLKADLFGFACGFSALNQVIAFFGVKFPFFSAIVTLINEFVICLSLKNICEQITNERQKVILYILLFIYIGYFGIFYNAIAIRASLAISFSILGYSYKMRSSKIKMFISYILAFSFHTSSIFFIIVAFLIDKIKFHNRNSYLIWWVIILFIWLSKASKIFVLFLAQCMQAASNLFPFLIRYNYYIDKLYAGNVIDIFASKKNILFLLLGILFILCRKYINDRKYDQLLNMYMFGLTLLFSLNTISEIYRLSDFFMVSMVPLTYISLVNSNLFSRKSSFWILNAIVLMQIIISLRITGIYF